jgi:hypothetical protein
VTEDIEFNEHLTRAVIMVVVQPPGWPSIKLLNDVQ